MTTITEPVLTRQDVRALMNADAICFDHNADGTGQIRAILRAENSSTGFEQTHTIRASTSRVQNYERGLGREDGPFTGFAMFMYAKHDETARTIVRHLHEGSKFALVWTRDNASPITDQAGLVRDELRITIQRKGARVVADTFLAQVFIGKDDTARMVRPA